MTNEPRVPKRGELWRHYKGGVYEVLCLARHSEDNTLMVIYQKQTAEPEIPWCRPLKMWLETVNSVPRFAFTGMTAVTVSPL